MRNLKRALSLALASVMLMGMMVVGSSAASYPDVDVADNLEAIEVLKAVGIMTGDEKGNFNPDSLVTRNEMAVVMVNLLGLKAGGTHPFTDVPTWANDYVAACYNNGIIAGTSATTFGGSADVTAVQAGLMVMKALGYFGYQGEFADDWKVATVKQANKIDLYDGINAYTDQSMSRNEVAQMVLNALECTIQVVTQVGGLSVDGNGITVVQNPTYTYTDAENRSGKDYAGKSNTTTMELCEKIFGTDLKKNSDTTDDFGRPASSWTYGTSTITTPKAADLTYTKGVKGKAIYEDLGKVSGVRIADLTNSTWSTAQVTIDGAVKTVGGGGGQVYNGLTITSGNNVEIGGKGTLTEVFFDKDTKIATIVQINTYLAQATSDYDKDDDELDITVHSSITMASGANTLDGEDFAISNYREDDYILVNAVESSGIYTIKAIAPANVVGDVTVSAYKTSDYVTANGTKYEYNKVAATASSGALGQATYMAGSYTLQNTAYDLIMDSHGYVIGVDTHSSDVDLGDYVFLTDAAKSGFEYIAKAVFMDGTTKNITISKTATVGGSLTDVAEDSVQNGTALAADGDLSKNRFYSFSVNKNGEYELTDLADGTRQAKITNTIVNGPATPVTTGKPANANTVFIAKDKVYTGVKNAPDVASSDVYCLLDKGSNYLLAAYTGTKGTSSSSASEYVYITSTTAGSARDENDVNYKIYDAVIDGKKVSGGLNVNTGSSVTAAGLYEITGYTDGYADLSAVITASVSNELTYAAGVTALTAKSGTLTVGSNSYVLDDDVVIYSVDGTDNYSARTITESNINNLSGTFTVYLIQKSSSNSDIVIAYLVKTA